MNNNTYTNTENYDNVYKCYSNTDINTNNTDDNTRYYWFLNPSIRPANHPASDMQIASPHVQKPHRAVSWGVLVLQSTVT